MMVSRIGATTRQGLTTEIRLHFDDLDVTVRLMPHEAEQLVASILLALAQQDALRWQQIYDDVREVRRGTA